MTDDKLQKGTSTVTTQEDFRGGQSFETLLPEEEKALRMLHGLSEGNDHLLSFALGGDEDTRLKLAMIEKNLLEAFKRTPAPDLGLEESHIVAKAKIIDALRDD